ncbi:MAG: ABC transporter permease [Acidimicrobiales bacterium]
MSEFFTLSVLVATIATAVRLAVPYLLAALGETISQRSGVLNLGVDGVMLLSAFGSYYTVVETRNHLLGFLVGLAIGLFMGLVYGFVTVVLHAEQGISGIGIFLFGLGFSDLLFQELIGTPRIIPGLPRVSIPGLSSIPHLGDALFEHSLITYIAFALVPAVTWMMNKTTFGLNIRAVGENPQAADSLGVSVARTRFAAIAIGNTMAGLAGAALSLELAVFQHNLTNGIGFIAVALVYFGAWRSRWVMGGALLYGMVTATRLKWQSLDIIPQGASDLAAMTPAIITILALVLLASRVRGPAALTKPFTRH